MCVTTDPQLCHKAVATLRGGGYSSQALQKPAVSWKKLYNLEEELYNKHYNKS